MAASCAGAELACISAAATRGPWVLRKPSLIHVTVDHGRALQKGFRVRRAPKPLTALDICAQSMRCLPELDALCIVESAVVRGMVSLRGLRGTSAGLRDADLRRIIDQVNPYSQSIIETVARYLLRKAGLSVQVQVYIPGVGRLDLFVEGLVGIEVDGPDFHSGAAEFEEDRRRWNLLTVGRIRILRVTCSLLVNRPEQFLDLVAQALGTEFPTDQGLSVGISRQSR